MHRCNGFRLLSFCFLVTLFSCGKPLPSLDNFDQATWKADTDACGNKRLAMVESLQRQQDKLLALDEMKIVALLGPPDRNELYKRNQKFYYYFLEPAGSCAGSNTAAPRRLAIRFNAMGLAKELMIE